MDEGAAMSDTPTTLPQFVWAKDHQGTWTAVRVVGNVFHVDNGDGTYGPPVVRPKRVNGSILVELPAADGQGRASQWWPASQIEEFHNGQRPEAF